MVGKIPSHSIKRSTAQGGQFSVITTPSNWSILGYHNQISLGKVNYCLNALIANGWVKAKRFRHNENKLGYAYVLTPDGIEEKAELTLQFLHRKLAEYEALEEEIRELRQEAEEQRSLRREIAPLGLE